MIVRTGYYTVAGLWTASATKLKETGERVYIRSLPNFCGAVDSYFDSVVLEIEAPSIREAYERVGIPVAVEALSTPTPPTPPTRKRAR